jgi:hypothetical protein
MKKIYIAHGGGLLSLDRGQLNEVKIPFKNTRDFHRLHASQKFLCSFGTSRILKFDGKNGLKLKSK